MFRSGKFFKSAAVVAAGLCLLNFINTSCLAAEAASTSRTKNEQAWELCGEEEYLLLSEGNHYAGIYDSTGILVGRCRAYLEEAFGAAVVKKDSIVDYADGSVRQMFSMERLQNVLEFPLENYDLQTDGSVCLATDRYTGQFSLYDSRGALLYASKDSEWADGGYSGRLLALSDGYLAGSYLYGEDHAVISLFPVWVSCDGQEIFELKDPYLRQKFADWELQGFGENLLVYSWRSQTGGVYSMNGELLLDQVSSFVSPYGDNDWSYNNWFPSYQVPIELVFKPTDGMYAVYNTKLDECAVISASQDGYQDFAYASGFLKDVSYEELEGRRCEGFLYYQGIGYCPYARAQEGYVLNADGELISIPMEQDQSIEALNRIYAVIGSFRDGEYRSSLIDWRTGEHLEDARSDETGSSYFELGEDYCIVTEIDYNDDYRRSIWILNDQKEISYHADKASARAWKNGLLLLDRGIYKGIADHNGNWIIRTIYGQTE